MLMFSYRLADKLLLYPSDHPIPTSAERIEILVAKGRRVEAYRRQVGKADGPPLFILNLTGNAGRAEVSVDLSEQLLRFIPEVPHRVEIVALQYPGYGGSPGRASLRGVAESARAAFDFIAEEAQGAPILIHALSMGTTAALWIAAEVDYPQLGLVLEKPPFLRAQILESHGAWNLWLLAGPVALGLPRSARSELSAERIAEVPALFIAGEFDNLVPATFCARVADRYRGPKKLIMAAVDHNYPVLPTNCPELSQSLSWLLSQLNP